MYSSDFIRIKVKNDLFINTRGYVTGSEFGMLISIVNQLGLILMWLGLLGLRLLLSGRLKTSAPVP